MKSLDHALEYIDAGFSVFPLTPKSKRPLIKWSRYQRERADKASAESWWTEWEEAGIAIVAGEISGGLVVLDVDHYDFSKWLEDRAEALGTWVVRTGSGKSHIYLKSRERCVTTELKGAGDEFLADIRADGQGLSGPSYLASPPTIHPSTEKPYTTLFGDPFHIRTVENANFLYTEIGRKFAGTARLTARDNSNAIPAVLEALPGISEEGIRRKLADERLPGKIRRAIEQDAAPGEGEWSRTHTHSEVDFAVACALYECGWGDEDIHAIFHYLPIGAAHYRDPARPGRDYLSRTLGAAMEKVERGREAASVAEGENFKIERVVKVAWDEPKYDVYFTNESGQPRLTTIDHDDLFAETGFRKKLAKSMAVLPVLKVEHSGSKKKFEAFANILLQMASIEEVPEAATIAGHFRTEVRSALRNALRRSKNNGLEPERPEEFDILWADENSIYVRGSRLVNEIGKVMRSDPTAVWEAIKHFGGEPRIVTYGDPPTSEELWVMPKAIIG